MLSASLAELPNLKAAIDAELAKRGANRLDASLPPDWFHEGQIKGWQSRAMDIVACAGTQGGKTASESPWLLREIQRCAPLILKLGLGNFICAGPTLTLMQAQAIPQFRDLFEGEHRLGKFISGQKPKFHFSDEGAKRLLGFYCPITIHFAYTNDSSNLESVTALGGTWDEAGQKENKLASYRAYNRRLKAARSTTFGQMRDWILADPKRTSQLQWWLDSYYKAEGPEARFGRRYWGTTPYEWGWFKDLVVDPAIEKRDGFEFHNWPSWMNPLVSESECRKELDNGMPLWEWQMMYQGMFTMPAGAIFDCFDAQHNTCKRFVATENTCPQGIPLEWRRWPGMDFGNVNTAAVKIAEELEELPDGRWGKPTGRLFVYQEYAKRGDDAAEHSRALKLGEPRRLIGAGGNANTESGWRQAYSAQGVILVEPPKDLRDVEVQIQCVYGSIKKRELVFFDDLQGTIGQIRHMSRELDDSGRPTKKIKDEQLYHFVAALRYLMVRLRPPKTVKGQAPAERFKR